MNLTFTSYRQVNYPAYIHTMRPVVLLFFLFCCSLACQKAPPPPVTDYTMPKVEDIVMYELFPRSFSAAGTLEAITERLDELQTLGINCIWLMPIYPVGEDRRIPPLGSPYSVRNFKAIAPEYGDTSDFRKLVEAAHERDMAIILDFVANHTAWDHPWITQQPEMYTQDANGNIVIPPGTNWQDVADLNFDHAPTRDSMIAAMQWWVETFDIDGYRCDYAEGVPVDFWADCIRTLESKQDLIMLAEGEDVHLLTDGGFDIAFSWTLYNRMGMAFSGARSADWPGYWAGTEKDRDPAGTYRLRMLTNHDKVSFEDLPLTHYQSYDGIRSAAVALTFMPGVPMLYNGQEVGSQQRLNLFSATPISWDDPLGFRAFFTQLYTLYQQFPELRTGDYTYYDQRLEVMSFARMGDERSLVICNVRNSNVTIARPIEWQGLTLTDQFTGTSFSGDSLTLTPYQYLLLRQD